MALFLKKKSNAASPDDERDSNSKMSMEVDEEVSSDSSTSSDNENDTKNRVKGECTQWSHKKGCGFIKTDNGESVRVYSKGLQGTDRLRIGDRVEFVVKVSPETKTKSAVHVTVIEDEREPETFVVAKKKYKGVVGMHHQVKGYGFINRDGQEKDIRFEIKDASFVEGDAVIFQIATGSRGNIQAQNVTFDQNVSRERVKGECSRWNKEKGFGFIRVDDGEEIFVHYRCIQGGDALNFGDRVEFEVAMNSRNGNKSAVRVTVIEDEREPETFVVDDEQHKGLIGAYYLQGGYGYIKRDGHDAYDVYFKKKNAELAPGDAVTFQLATGSRGSLKARNVRIDSNVSRERFTGKCNYWNKEKGYGFVKRDDGKKQIYVHHNNIQGSDTLNFGDRVKFEVVDSTKKGKKMAVRVQKMGKIKGVKVTADDLKSLSKKVASVKIDGAAKKKGGVQKITGKNKKGKKGKNRKKKAVK